ncbi:MAG: putative DNA-binding protein [Syntrophomonadaceae bacterium]
MTRGRRKLDKPEQMVMLVMLKDFYGPLLTEKQQAVLDLYCENDWSFSEIAGLMNISRQAVYDLIKRAQNSLETYESKLGLLRKFLDTRKQLEEVYTVLTTDDNLDKQKLTKVIKTLQAIIEEV